MDYNTPQQIVDKLTEIRSDFLNSGKLMQKNITTPEGSSIFYRSLDDIEKYIELYQYKVDTENQVSGFPIRIPYHV